MTKDVQSMVCLDMYSDTIDDEGKLRALFQKEYTWRQGEKGDITITFGQYPCDNCTTNSSWSLIGSEATIRPYPAINLAWVDPPFGDFEYDGITYLFQEFILEKRNMCDIQATNISECPDGWVPGYSVLHEFGHALGMKHEHQNNVNNDNKLVFNVPVVEAYMAKPENGGWSKERVHNNIINRYSSGLYDGSTVDSKSIMMYPIPNSWLLSGTSNKTNYVLSETDKAWLSSKYPLNSSNKPQLTIYFLDNNSEWKKAWIKKVISEKLAPYVGINFIFNKKLLPLPPGETYPPPTMEPISPMSSVTILIIIVLSMILFGMLVYYVK